MPNMIKWQQLSFYYFSAKSICRLDLFQTTINSSCIFVFFLFYKMIPNFDSIQSLSTDELQLVPTQQILNSIQISFSIIVLVFNECVNNHWILLFWNVESVFFLNQFLEYAALDSDSDTCAVFEFAFSKFTTISTLNVVNDVVCQRMLPPLKNMFDEVSWTPQFHYCFF